MIGLGNGDGGCIGMVMMNSSADCGVISWLTSGLVSIRSADCCGCRSCGGRSCIWIRSFSIDKQSFAA